MANIDEFSKVTHKIRYRLFDKYGIPFGPYPTRQAAAEMARELWPDEPQADDEHVGWDIETV